MEISKLKQLLIQSWNLETCSPGLRDKWSEENPSLGQCAITALIVNDFFGGKIMRCMASSGSHYYNIIDDELVDLTVEQFLGEIPQYENGEERTREYLLNNKDTKNRYEKLLYNLKQSLRQFQGKQFRLIDRNGQEYLSNTPGTLGGNRKLKIYGRLDCPSAKRWIEKGYYISNRVFFENEDIAIAAGYRPCAKCMPDKYKEWKNDQIKKIDFKCVLIKEHNLCQKKFHKNLEIFYNYVVTNFILMMMEWQNRRRKNYKNCNTKNIRKMLIFEF